MNQERQQG